MMEQDTRSIELAEMPQERGGHPYIGRYMSFAKFLVMLLNKEIYFPRADQLNDDQECRYPTLRTSSLPGVENLPTAIDNSWNKIVHSGRERHKRYFVSCWYDSEDGCPNDTMWRAYAEDGVFVVFDKQRLVEALGQSVTHSYGDRQNDPILPKGYGPVEYCRLTDFQQKLQTMQPIPHPAFQKRYEFHPENEYRIVFDIDQFMALQNGRSVAGVSDTAVGLTSSLHQSIDQCGLVRVVSNSKLVGKALLSTALETIGEEWPFSIMPRTVAADLSIQEEEAQRA